MHPAANHPQNCLIPLHFPRCSELWPLYLTKHVFYCLDSVASSMVFPWSSRGLPVVIMILYICRVPNMQGIRQSRGIKPGMLQLCSKGLHATLILPINNQVLWRFRKNLVTIH